MWAWACVWGGEKKTFQTSSIIVCLIRSTNSYLRLQYFTSLALLFTHYLKLSSRNRFPVQGSAFQLSMHHQNTFSFRQRLPWAGSARSRNNFRARAPCLHSGFWTAFEMMSSSSLQDVDENKQKMYLQSEVKYAAMFQQVQPPIEEFKWEPVQRKEKKNGNIGIQLFNVESCSNSERASWKATQTESRRLSGDQHRPHSDNIRHNISICNQQWAVCLNAEESQLILYLLCVVTVVNSLSIKY